MMTPRQKQLLDFLSAEAREGRCPTFRQMYAHLGINSAGGLTSDLDALECEAFVRRIPDRACAIEVLRPTGPDRPVRKPTPRIELGRHHYIPIVWNAALQREEARA